MFHVERIHSVAKEASCAKVCNTVGMHIEVIARLLIVSNKHVLVCHSIDGGYGYLPGGHVEFGEPAAQAAQRELLEEAGLRCKVGELALVSEVQFKTAKRVHQEVNFIFRAELESGMFHVEHGAPPPVPSLEDHLAFIWVPVGDLVSYDFKPKSHVKTIQALATGKPAASFLSDWPAPK
jgi:8-oxo-dGTP diphosphatase